MITKIRLIKTLKAGSSVWEAGLELPNRAIPVIPDTLLKEVRRRTGTVEVLERKAPPPVPVSEVISNTKTSTTIVSRTSNDITPLKKEEEEFEEQVKGISQEEKVVAPAKTEKKSPKPRPKKAPKPKRDKKSPKKPTLKLKV